MKRRLEPPDASRQQLPGAFDRTDQPRQVGHVWLTPDEAIAYLKIGSLTALYRLIADHRLPFGRLGRRYRFRTDRLDQWMEVRGVAALQKVS